MPKVKIRPKDIRDMSEGEIKVKIAEQHAKLMNEKAEGVIVTQSSTSRGKESPGRQGAVRRNIARLKTILNEKKREREEE